MTTTPRPNRSARWAGWLATVLSVGLCLTPAMAADPPPLSQVPVPLPPNLSDYVVSRSAAVALGKALFWDMQVGSDGVQACATCHFQAGADVRVKNQVRPIGLVGDGVFQVVPGPNATIDAAAFPFHQRVAPRDRQRSAVLRDSDDVMSSQGVRFTQFVDIVLGNPVDLGTPVPDPVFNVGGVNVRRVEPRNTPTSINSQFNIENFWDGRASQVFNGNNPFGPRDPQQHAFVTAGANLVPTLVRIEVASAASQAVGPPLSDFEMSWAGRTWPKVGKKMLSLTPLGQQAVHTQDSVLGLFSNAPAPGLNVSYASLVQAAFRPELWNNATQHVELIGGVATVVAGPPAAGDTNQFSQMEANFSLFFGLAVMLYEATLVSDQTPFDRFVAGDDTAISEQAQRGFGTFKGAGKCADCHDGALFTRAVPVQVPAGLAGPLGEIAEQTVNRRRVLYDDGFHNIAVRPTPQDIGRGDVSPFINPLTGQPYPLSFTRMAILAAQGLLPADVAQFVPPLPAGGRGGAILRAQARLATAVAGGNARRIARAQAQLDAAIARAIASVDGAHKIPGLRNVELTGPYMHNGGMSTLTQVVEFYTRGANFPAANADNLAPEIREIGKVRGKPERVAELVAFMLTLTDERVRTEQAPFDHPELRIPVGAQAGDPSLDDFQVLPAVGGGGRPVEGLPPLDRFLGLDPFAP